MKIVSKKTKFQHNFQVLTVFPVTCQSFQCGKDLLGPSASVYGSISVPSGIYSNTWENEREINKCLPYTKRLDGRKMESLGLLFVVVSL